MDPFLPPDPKDRHVIGGGLSIAEWLKKPEKQVTRIELWEVLKAYDTGRQRVAREQKWYRRFWRYLTADIRPKNEEEPSTP